MEQITQVQKQESVPAPTVVSPTTARKSLRKDKAAAKFSGSPGLKAFAEAALGIGDAKVAPAASKTASKAAAKPKATPAPLGAKERQKVANKAAPAPAVALAPVAKVAFVPRVYSKGQPIYMLDDKSRPVSGRLLLAHTHAALTILGLLDAARPVVKKSQLLTLIGQRAVNYHLTKDNIETAPDHGVRLSTLGYNVFNDRMKSGKIDTEAAMLFQSAFLDGKPDGKINVKAGNLYSAIFN